MWYSSVYRRHLCDMHIDDWNEEFLSEFSPEEYCENLKKAKIQSAMLYLQSHVGHCYYPTKTGHMHNALNGREDIIRHLEQLCHKNKIYVTGYYSLIYNTYEHDRHPEWRMLMEDGVSSRLKDGQDVDIECSNASASRYGFCCPNNLEYREFVFKQIEEMLEYFEVDGMFYDMPFWPHICYCDDCKKRWANEVGGNIPTKTNMNDPIWQKHMEKRRQWMGEFVQAVTDKTKEINPNLSVEHNFAMAVAASSPEIACSYEVNDACDYAGGDLYGGVLEHSFTCKLYRNITKNEPFEYMFGRCTPTLSMHTVTKSVDQITQSVFLTAAHHGATFVIDAINPIGTMDSRFYDRMGKVFDKQIPYEKHFAGNMVEDVGVYYSINSNFHLHENEVNNKTCAVNAVKTMIENHIPVGVTGSFSNLDKYKAIIAPYLTYADENDNERLINYVKNGGTLYISGSDNITLLQKFFNAEVTGYTKSGVVYTAPKDNVDFGWFNKDYPLPFNINAPIIKNIDGDVIATITYPYTDETDIKFASIHSNPPGIETDIPAIAEKQYGRGRVIWSAVPIEASANFEYKQIFISLLHLSDLSVECDAEDTTEIVTFKTDNGIYINAVELSEKYNIKTTDGFTIKVKCEVNPTDVICVGCGKSIDFTYEDGYVKFNIENFNIFTMYKINLFKEEK